jgi:hypothetical protein
MEQVLAVVLGVALVLLLVAALVSSGRTIEYWRARAEKAEAKYRAVMADIVRMD